MGNMWFADVWQNAVAVSKTDLKAGLRDYTVAYFADVATFEATTTAGLRRVLVGNTLYRYDSSDTTTATNGTSCLVSADGQRYKSTGFASYHTTTPIDTDADYYFADYECKGANFIRLIQSENQSAVSGGGFREALVVEHNDGDTVDYTLIGQKVSYGVRSYVTAIDPTQAQYKDLVAGTFESIGRIEWADRGVSGVTAGAIQYGIGIASNEFLASNPATATNASLSMAAVQPIVSAKKAANDATHKYYGVRATNIGKRITAAFSAISAGTGGDDGQFQYGLDLYDATVDAAGAAIRMPQSESGNEGTNIEYDSNDYTGFIRSSNIYFWVVGGNIVGALSAANVVFSAAQYLPVATQLANAVVTPRVQSIGTDNEKSSFLGARFSADTGGPVYYLAKSRNASEAGHTVVQSGDNLGSISFAGSDGTAFAEGARIMAQVDGTPGSGDMPGRLVFLTSLDGAESPAEHLRLNNRGDLGHGVTAGPFAGTQTGRRYFSIKGQTERGVIQIGSDAADADLKSLGNMEWHDATNGFRASYIATLLRGTTANNRGAGMAFGVKGNNTTTVSETLLLDEKTNVILGNLTAAAQMATSATDGFVYARSMAGNPSGTPTAFLGTSALALDTANGRIWMYDGSAWRGPREVLTANRTYYVRTDGSNSNNGLANTAGGAFATLQKAIDVVASLDISIYDVTIQLNSATHTSGASVTAPWVGIGSVEILGDAATPSNVTISTTNASAISVTGGGRLKVRGVSLQTTTAGSGIYVGGNSRVDITGLIRLGACALAHLYADGGTISSAGNKTVYGNASFFVLSVAGGSIVFPNTVTVTFSGSPTISYLYYLTRGGRAEYASGTFSGTVTTQQYVIDTGSVLYSLGTTLPGTAGSGGTTTGGGFFV